MGEHGSARLLRELRSARGLSQQNLAAPLPNGSHVTQADVSELERLGEMANMSAGKMEAALAYLADALGHGGDPRELLSPAPREEA